MTDEKDIKEGDVKAPVEREGAVDDTKDEGAPAEVRYSKDEVEKLIQDRLTAELEKAEEEKKQAEELAKLSGAEKAKRELEIETEKFERERQKFQLEKTELEVTKQLAEKGLPVNFAKLLIADNAEASFENIKEFEKEWQTALETAVKDKLKGSSPQGGGTITKKGKSEIGSRLAEKRKQSTIAQKDNPYF